MLERLPFGKQHDAGSNGEETTLESRAVLSVRKYLYDHAANLERAVRLEEKAERLEEAGTPSESARYRAERARSEVLLALTAIAPRLSGRPATKGLVLSTGRWSSCARSSRRVLSQTGIPSDASASVSLTSGSGT
jgi:hypothetical protein